MGFHGVPHSTPELYPFPKILGRSPNQNLFCDWLVNGEIAFRFQQTNCTYYRGVSRGTAPDLLARPPFTNLGDAPKLNLYYDWLVIGDR